MLKRNRITLDQTKVVIEVYDQIPIRFLEVDLLTAMEVAADHNLYAYDAYILSCAIENRCSLISLDKGLLRAARNAGLSIVEVPQ
jgi:predicted nucleic acid-binding protein